MGKCETGGYDFFGNGWPGNDAVRVSASTNTRVSYRRATHTDRKRGLQCIETWLCSER